MCEYSLTVKLKYLQINFKTAEGSSCTIFSTTRLAKKKKKCLKSRKFGEQEMPSLEDTWLLGTSPFLLLSTVLPSVSMEKWE